MSSSIFSLVECQIVSLSGAAISARSLNIFIENASLMSVFAGDVAVNMTPRTARQPRSSASIAKKLVILHSTMRHPGGSAPHSRKSRRR